MRAGLEQHEMQNHRLSSDTYRSPDDDNVECADTLNRAVARNIDIDSAVIELNGISEPLNVSILIVALHVEIFKLTSCLTSSYQCGKATLLVVTRCSLIRFG